MGKSNLFFLRFTNGVVLKQLGITNACDGLCKKYRSVNQVKI